MNSYEAWEEEQPDPIEEKCKYLGIDRNMYETLSELVKDFQQSNAEYSHSFWLKTHRKIEHIKHVLEV